MKTVCWKYHNNPMTSEDLTIPAIIERFNYSPQHIGYAALTSILERFKKEVRDATLFEAAEIVKQQNGGQSVRRFWERDYEAILAAREKQPPEIG